MFHVLSPVSLGMRCHENISLRVHQCEMPARTGCTLMGADRFRRLQHIVGLRFVLVQDNVWTILRKTLGDLGSRDIGFAGKINPLRVLLRQQRSS